MDINTQIIGSGPFAEKIATKEQLNSKCTITISRKSGKENMSECIPLGLKNAGSSKSKKFVENVEMFYKTKGPAKSTQLLDNFNIDETLERFEVFGKEMFEKRFYHVNFQMIDFLECGGELAEI